MGEDAADAAGILSGLPTRCARPYACPFLWLEPGAGPAWVVPGMPSFSGPNPEWALSAIELTSENPIPLPDRSKAEEAKLRPLSPLDHVEVDVRRPGGPW